MFQATYVCSPHAHTFSLDVGAHAWLVGQGRRGCGLPQVYIIQICTLGFAFAQDNASATLQAVWDALRHLGLIRMARGRQRDDGHLYGVQPHGLQPQQAVLPKTWVYPEVMHPASCTPRSVPARPACDSCAVGPVNKTSAALAQGQARVCGPATSHKAFLNYPWSCAVAINAGTVMERHT